jgi:hypothetical protein
MRIITFLLLLACYGVFGQERVPAKPVIRNRPLEPKEVLKRAIGEIGKIRNSETITEVNIGIPMMPFRFLDPVVVKEVVSVNRADTLKGSSFQYFTLEDSFKLHMAYDGRYFTRAVQDENRTETYDLTGHESEMRGIMGPLDLRISALFKVAMERNAGLKVTQTPDSLSVEITFPDVFLACNTQGISFLRDTVGVVTRYVITLDPNTYLPLRELMHFPYHTNIETVLHRRVNFVDTLKISALMVNGRLVNAYEPRDVKADTVFEDRFNDRYVQDWKLMEAEGDSLQFSLLKGKRCMMVFNSMGWKPCQMVIPFLKQLKQEYKPGDFDFVSIDPYINQAGALKRYKAQEGIDYPVLAADVQMRRRYRIPEVPVFMLIDRQGKVRKVIVGFEGKDTERQVREAIAML